MIPSLAFLRHADGQVRQVCLGCSKLLYGLGMLRIVEEKPMSVLNAPPDTYCSIVYEIAPPFTLANCRSMARRHVGPPWGA
jgi:hypothetical protein